MNGAQALIATLVDNGVDVCFANPGTSEMHFVAALDTVPQMRGVLALFEGVATGAADGYARMSDNPAAVLLHLGPGLGNGLANLHNARRAGVPMLVVIGDHATYHKKYDAPLESDIDSVAQTVSGWVRRTMDVDQVALDTAEGVASARAGREIATLILPADTSWSDGADTSWSDGADGSWSDVAGLGASAGVGMSHNAAVDTDEIIGALESGEPTVIFVGGDATRVDGLMAAARLASHYGARVLCETFPTRLQRGAGLPPVERLGYLAEAATAQLAGVRHLILAGARSPVSFFAYPGKASDLVPEGCAVHTLAGAIGAAQALSLLADQLASTAVPDAVELNRPALPKGTLNVVNSADVIGATMPENCIVVDESNTSGFLLPAATAGAPQHDWLTLTGGAIGYALPVAVGAAIACPDRPVLCLESDGSAMYTISALWTQAREQLDITTIVYSNKSYDILRIELQRVGALDAAAGGQPGPKTESLLDIAHPTIDFVRLAEGMGVPARSVNTAEDLAEALRWAYAQPGPHLIEAAMPSIAGMGG